MHITKIVFMPAVIPEAPRTSCPPLLQREFQPEVVREWSPFRCGPRLQPELEGAGFYAG